MAVFTPLIILTLQAEHISAQSPVVGLNGRQTLVHGLNPALFNSRLVNPTSLNCKRVNPVVFN